MKNTEIIQAIKAEIERLIAMNKTRNGFPAGTMCAVRIEAYEKLLSFLSTLEEEPVQNDLEEAADNHICEVVDSAGHPGWDWETQDIKDAFKAGAEWQKEQDDKELSDLLTIAHLQGAEQMKEQMLKEDEK